MGHEKDITVLILRFIFGGILGGLLTLMMVMIGIWILNLKMTNAINVILVIGGSVTLLTAVSATIWGDKFLVGFLKIFKIFKYF